MVVQVGFGRVHFRSFPCCSYSALDRVRLLCVTVEYFLIVSGAASLHDQVCLKERVDGSLFLNEWPFESRGRSALVNHTLFLLREIH